ncbi:MAG: MBL fold metallo-hydrolase, partial [Acidimicrobiia bacterium]
NTSCVAVSKGGERPTLVLDAGTGLQKLTKALAGKPFQGSILLGHLHWDHTHGIPFFGAGDRPDARANLLMPAQGDAGELMDRVMSPPHFPITTEELRGEWWVGSLEPGKHEIEGFEVLALEIPHKGGRTFGFRISDGRSTIAYLSDHSPINFGPGPDSVGEYHDAARTLAEGVDLLIHDAQYTNVEFPDRATFGHSTVEYAIGLAEASMAKGLLLFHHDPSRTDDQLDEILSQHQASCPWLDAAIEGTSIELPARALSR